MNHRSRDRLAEWADLVDASVPEGLGEDDAPADASPGSVFADADGAFDRGRPDRPD